MPDFLKEIFQKVTDIFFNFNKKLDKISAKIYEQTGVKINIGMIIIGILLLIFTFSVVSSILGWVKASLFGN